MRLRFVIGVIILVWIVLITRVYYLSIKSNEYYEEIAEENVIKTTPLAPTRGQILDRKGKPMAINRLGFSISIAPHLKKNDGLMQEIDNLVSLFPDLNSTKLLKAYQRQNSVYNQDYIKVVDFIDYNETISHFVKLKLRPNLKIEPASQRFYPYNSLASHIIGYVGRLKQRDIEQDPVAKLVGYTGRSGVEGYYNSILQGENGERKTKVTALNQFVEEISYIPPKSSDISLHIDLELQKYIEEIFGDNAGAAVVINVKDGSIIAAGSFPEYNLNPFVTGISAKEWNEIIKNLDHPFTNKLVNGLYPPGSVIKMGVGMSFLNSGKITKDTNFFCGGFIELGNRKFRCWNTYGHGDENIISALRDSCDVYFYKGSLEVGIDYISAYLEKLGLGKKTNIDLPNEFVGTIPNKAWKMEKFRKPWFNGETVITSIGQGNMLVTPVQIAKYTAEIASGIGITPHFLKSIDGKEVKFEPQDIFSDFEKSQLPYIREGMYQVANQKKGTAYKILHDNIIPVAAKTGTAQVVTIPQNERVRMKEQDMEYFKRSHAWITTYGPFENPQYAVTVLVEHGGHGGSAGGPIVKKIYSKLVEMGYIDLNQTNQAINN